MLKLRPARRSTPGVGDVGDLRFEIRDGEMGIGALAYDHRDGRGAFTIGDDAFVLARLAGESDAPPAPGGPASPVFALSKAGGVLLARAERDREVFVVGRGAESFILQPGRSRRYFNLQREGDVVSLGGVGRRQFWTRGVDMDLPNGFAASFQVFLASLLLDVFARRQGRLAA